MNVVDLFSGIGGFALGFEDVGFHTLAFCESDPHARQILRRHYPGTEIHNDIRTFPAERYRGSTHVVCGGFPCQPVSQAGQQRGQDDDRWLWPEMLSVIRIIAPRFVVAENVFGIVHMELDTVLSDLEASGYTWFPFVLPAAAVDASHRRDRVFVVADRDGQSERHSTVHAALASASLAAAAYAHGATEAFARAWAADSYTHREYQEDPQRLENIGHWIADNARPGHWRPGHYPPEPDVGRVVHGVPTRVDKARLRMLGNAVHPLVAATIGAILKAFVEAGL